MENQKNVTGKDLCTLLVNTLPQGPMEYNTTTDWEAVFKDFIEALDYTIEKGANIEESLAYYAVGYSYNWKVNTNCVKLTGITKTEGRQKVILYFEKYLQCPSPNEEICNLCFVLNSLAEAYEKEYDFKSAIKYFDLYDIEFKKQFIKEPKITYKKNSDGIRIKYLEIKENGWDFFIEPNTRTAPLYLKLGTQLAVDYWNLQTKSSYYEENSYYKQQVDYFLSEALYKHSIGYIYKPQAKVDQIKYQQAMQRGK